MKTTIVQNRPRALILSAFILSMLLFGACKIILVSSYDDKIVEQIENLSKSIDKFYLTMLETTTETGGGRAYSNFAEQYIAIDIELQFLLNKNKARAKNEETVEICEKTIKLFEKYKNEHKKDNTISNADITLNLNSMRRILEPLLISEIAKKMAK